MGTGIAILVFFIIGEGMVRVYTRYNVIYDMEMSRYSRTLKEVSPNPRIGHVHKANGNAKLMGVDVETNSDGLRDRDYPLKKGGAYRIIFLGDSLTLGWGVEYEHTFEYLMEKSLNKKRPVETINFGTGNYNTDQEVSLFLEKGLKYQPDMVALFYFINDAEITPVIGRWGFLEHSELITFYWSKLNVLLNRFTRDKDYRNYYARLYNDDHPGWKQTNSAFIKIKDVCQERGIELRVIILPELHNPKDYPFKREHEKLSGFLRENNIAHHDLLQNFQSIDDPKELWVALDDAHPNAKAHALIAKYSEEFINVPDRQF